MCRCVTRLLSSEELAVSKGELFPRHSKPPSLSLMSVCVCVCVCVCVGRMLAADVCACARHVCKRMTVFICVCVCVCVCRTCVMTSKANVRILLKIT